MTDVTLCIETHHHAFGLGRLLDALAALETQHCVRLVVADTAPDRDAPSGGPGLDHCRRRTTDGYRWPITAFPLSGRDPARVRNALASRALDTGTPIFIVYLDDTACPAPGWLDALVGMQRRTDADFVGGPVWPEFEPGTPEWIVDIGLFGRHGPDDGEPCEFGALDGLLIRTTLFSRWRRPWFALEETTPETVDTRFVARAREMGVCGVWAEAAELSVMVSTEQTGPDWMLEAQREWARADYAAELSHRPDQTRLQIALAIGGILGAICWASFGWLTAGFKKAARFRALADIAVQRGRLAGLLQRSNGNSEGESRHNPV